MFFLQTEEHNGSNSGKEIVSLQSPSPAGYEEASEPRVWRKLDWNLMPLFFVGCKWPSSEDLAAQERALLISASRYVSIPRPQQRWQCRDSGHGQGFRVDREPLPVASHHILHYVHCVRVFIAALENISAAYRWRSCCTFLVILTRPPHNVVISEQVVANMCCWGG